MINVDARPMTADAIGPWRRTARDGAHLAVLSAFALAQPIFGLLGRNADFFVVRRSTGWDVVAFALIVMLVPPLILLAVELAAGLVHPAAARAVHLGAVALLIGLFALQAAKHLLDASSTALVLLAAAVGVLGALAYARAAVARSFLSALAPAPLVFAALFLFASPVSQITIAAEAHASVARVGAHAPAVVVVFDEFPVLSLLDGNGEIDRVRYPNFAALAARSTWFRRTLTVSGETTHAVPAILTGRNPRGGELPFFSDHPQNLFTLLGRAYRLDVVEPVTSLCPATLCPALRREDFVARQRALLSDVGVAYLHVVLPDGLRDRLPSITGTWADFHGGAVSDARRGSAHGVATLVLADALRDLRLRDAQFRAFAASLRSRPRPTLAFIHSILPHHPWRYLPSGRQYADATLIPGLEDDVWTSDAALVEQSYARHLLQVAFVDRLLGEFLGRLRAIGAYDRSLVVVTADHGVAFRPGEHRREVRPGNVAELGLVPLFVKAPGQRRGRQIDRLVRTTDVLPTIADVLGVRLPWPVDGRSAFTTGPRARARVATSPDGDEGFFVTARELGRRLNSALDRQAGLFGRGLYRVGPRAELVGRRVSDLRVRDARGVTSELARPELFRNARGGVSPAHVVGTLHGVGAGRDVAVAVNGRIAAVGRTLSFRGATRFEALAPDRAFRAGQNAVAIYIVSKAGGPIVLDRAR